jgi:hypothetical protein
MKFKYVGKAVKTQVYNGLIVSPGDVVEYEGHFADKALRNPDFVKVDGRGRKKVTSSDDAGQRANSDDGFSVDEVST